MKNPFSALFKKSIPSPVQKEEEVIVPPGRISSPDIEQSLSLLSESLEFVTPDFSYEMIPTIRKLLKVNSSVSLAANSIVELANTGFELEFTGEASDDDKEKMKDHLRMAFKRWGYGTAGIHGIINKFIYQVYVGGAISVEWVPLNDLTGIDYPAIINPENIRVAFNHSKRKYEFYQVPKLFLRNSKKNGAKGLKDSWNKLNPITYQYLAFFTDEEKPIGTPPFLSALDDVQAQLRMLKNIGYVSDQLGLMGFLEFLMSKPSPKEGENPEQYKTRLNSLLDSSKGNIKDGLKDGIVVGYKNDHEFNFHSSTKDTSGVAGIFDINHRMVSNGLFTSPQFLGGVSQGSEAMLTVVFTKMLSQLNNLHMGISNTIERGIYLELSLAGFKYPEVQLKFKPSTITDMVKIEQGKEYKIRNLVSLYNQGIIGQPQFAKEMGYDKPDQEEPRLDPNEVLDPSKAKEKVEKDKDTSDRKTRDKNKPQPKRNDTKSSPR